MPDLATLLADVTTRTPPPAPVERVHATVRRRAARRRAATAATALAGVVTAAVVVTTAGGTDRGLEPAVPTPTPTPTPSPTAAAATRTGIDGIGQFVAEHPELFLGEGIMTSSRGGVTDVVVTFAGDVDPDEWTDDIDAVAAGQRWTAKQCAHSKEGYDAIAREVKAFTWPSGEKAYAGTVRLDVQFCAVEVSLPQGPRSDDDRAAATRRWGKDVRVLTWLSPPFPTPS